MAERLAEWRGEFDASLPLNEAKTIPSKWHASPKITFIGCLPPVSVPSPPDLAILFSCGRPMTKPKSS